LSVVGKHLRDVESSCNVAIERISEWLFSVGLELAAHKTEAVLVSTRSLVETAHIRVGSENIISKRAIRYLGVMIDPRLSYREHLLYVEEKATNTSRALFRMLMNARGPKQERRILLSSMVRSAITYGAAIWADAINVTSYARGIKSIHRLCALPICCGFRTISDDAALVIAGVIPIDLLVIEEKTVVEAIRLGVDRKVALIDARAESLTAWQSRWDTSESGRWTHRLIPDIRRWIKRSHGSELDYHLVQFLTRFQHVDTPQCVYCEDEVETAEHVLCKCLRFSDEREELNRMTGSQMRPRELMKTMMADADSWKTG
ncbi:hypothetical protein KR044_005576, partial [Drosophila immigrans]